MQAKKTDAVREYAASHYIQPARRRGEESVRIVAGDVHKALGFSNLVPLVCQALKSRKFLDANDLELEQIVGPPSGQGATLTCTYRMKSSSNAEKVDSFWKLRGIGKKLFAELGGGEAFLKEERKNFYGPDSRL